MLQPATRTPYECELPYQPLWPLAATLIGREPGVVLLDSGGEPGPSARWSLLAWRPRQVLAWPQGAPGALAALRGLLRRRAPAPTGGGALPLHGGWLGWLSYDLGRQIERLPSLATPDRRIPDFVLGEYDLALLEDRGSRRLFAVGTAADGREEAGFEARIEAVLRRPAAEALACLGEPGATSPPRPLRERRHYLAAVERILRYIEAGDIYQANFSHRFDARYTGPSAALYARLRSASPAPFGAYFGLPGAPELLSVSPELFLARHGCRVETEPIKGTRPRARDPHEDAAQLEALRDSAKERAELLMIVDLLRNDLGRVARVGSVRVEDLRRLTSHPTVHHAAARISACLDPAVETVDLLAATLPGGSVTGAPKIRAMEILEELEGVRRGPYTGCAGVIGYDGDLQLNILIRTMVRQGDAIHYHVGSGIVADSDPQAEYEETMAKGAALSQALTGAGREP